MNRAHAQASQEGGHMQPPQHQHHNHGQHHQNGGPGEEQGQAFMLALPFDDSSSNLDLPSLLQAATEVHSHSSGLSHDALWMEATKEQKANIARARNGAGANSEERGALPLKGAAGAKRKSTESATAAGVVPEAAKPAQAKRKKKASAAAAAAAKERESMSGDLSGGDDDEEDDGRAVSGEAKEIKRQMRLVKNRQAAQQFRKRQKQYIQDLEKRCSTLAAQNASFSAKIELLTTENRLIKEQLDYLRGFVSQAVSVSFAPGMPGAPGGGGPLPMPPGPSMGGPGGSGPAAGRGPGAPPFLHGIGKVLPFGPPGGGLPGPSQLSPGGPPIAASTSRGSFSSNGGSGGGGGSGRMGGAPGGGAPPPYRGGSLSSQLNDTHRPLL